MDQVPEHDKKVIRPWARLFARSFDIFLWSQLYEIIVYWLSPFTHFRFILDPYPEDHDLLMEDIVYIWYRTIELLPHLLVEDLIVIICYGFTDSIICKIYGRNLGHLIFGLKIFNETGHELTYRDYLKRSFLVSAYDELISCSFLSFFFIPAIIFYINYKKTGSTFWDRQSGMKVMPVHAHFIRTIIGLILFLALMFIVYVFETYHPVISI